MSRITLTYCTRVAPVENSTTKCNLEAKKSPQLNCPEAGQSQDLDAQTENRNASRVIKNPLEENGVTHKMSRLCRPSKRISFDGTAKTRNAYVNFMEEYRKDHKSLLPSQVMSQAASCWNRLSEDEKCKYKTDAQNAKYSYKSKNKTLNKVLMTLKSCVASKQINVSQLTKASRQIQFWKEEVLNSIKFDGME